MGLIIHENLPVKCTKCTLCLVLVFELLFKLAKKQWETLLDCLFAVLENDGANSLGVS